MFIRLSFLQDIEFFDDPKNGTGQLTARLATDASNVNGVRSFLLHGGPRNSMCILISALEMLP